MLKGIWEPHRLGFCVTENPCVAGSIPAHTTRQISLSSDAPERLFLLVQQITYLGYKANLIIETIFDLANMSRNSDILFCYR